MSAQTCGSSFQGRFSFAGFAESLWEAAEERVALSPLLNVLAALVDRSTGITAIRETDFISESLCRATERNQLTVVLAGKESYRLGAVLVGSRDALFPVKNALRFRNANRGKGSCDAGETARAELYWFESWVL
jgi:hypothetical protein